MLIHQGNHIGDTWYYNENGTMHCYYLTCDKSIARHTAWDIAHATSRNLVDWTLHGLVLRKGREDEWDGDCLATGSVLFHQGKYWMAYTGRWNQPDVAVGLAVSENLYSWEKCEHNPITRIDTPYYEKTGSGNRKFSHWRDPFLFKRDNRVYHYVCASASVGETDKRGSLGLAYSDDMQNWHILPPPSIEPAIQEFECPQVVEIGGEYFLIFSAFSDLFSKESKSKLGNQIRHTTYAMRAETHFGPFFTATVHPLVPEESEQQPYAGQIVEFNGSQYLLGTVWNDEQDFVSDPFHVNNVGGRLELSAPLSSYKEPLSTNLA